MSDLLEKDDSIQFPHLTVLKASAGSGKTYALTRRIVQFLLSEKIPKNNLRNILAVTFSNNSAKEMKERTLEWLKEVYFGNQKKIAELAEMTSLAPEEMQERAGRLIEGILENYADFQIKTIDSFMTTVFKASAIDFGYNPDFEILMDNRSLMAYAFNLFLRNVREGSAEAAALEEIVDSLLEYQKEAGAFLWAPSAALLEETRKIYRKISAGGKEAQIEEFGVELENLKKKITASVEKIENEIERSGLKRHGNSGYQTVLPWVRVKRFQDLGGKPYLSPPVTKPKKGKKEDQEAYERIAEMWDQFRILANELTVIYCRSKYAPYVKTFQAFTWHVERTKKQQEKIFIEDINSYLAKYLDALIVPDIYFRIGERIYHFLIDEFQDTSPVQWKNLFPLIENSLSQGGSLFLVGDTKQSIYGFRNADYTIMKELERSNPFPSARHEVKELDTNYRSKKIILDFNEKVFKTNLLENPDYHLAGQKSGLTEYVQKAENENENDGYLEVLIIDKSEDHPVEREAIQERIEALRSRGYHYREISILTQTNEHAVRATAWLNEKGIPFISYSSLDIRRRKILGELMALIRFFESPTDHFSFATFILGDIFSAILRRDFPSLDIDQLRGFCFQEKERSPLYKGFQVKYSSLWERYFESIFKVSGYLPIYDLVTEIFALFTLFENMPGEEAALIKFLEVVKEVDSRGSNNLADFLAASSDDENGDEDWDLSVPKNIEAVNVMTIHKSKGLGFPVVILLLYEIKNRGVDYILEEKGEIVHLLKINKGEASCDESLQFLYEKERMREMVNRLNSLYVGLTRPERELYLIGVTNKPEKYPFFLLPAEGYSPAAKPVYRPKISDGMPLMESFPLQHRLRQLEFPVSHERHVSMEERKRGEWIHRILFFIDDLKENLEDQIQNIVKRVKEESGADYFEPEICKLIQSLMNNREIRRYFTAAPGREIKKEQEFTDRSGRLFRMDRVVIEPETVAVIDYKTGKERGASEDDRAQLKNYMRIAGEVYPNKTIAGILLFVDRNEVEKVA
jgi:ATP-dependent helicase/nuclease subunit A